MADKEALGPIGTGGEGVQCSVVPIPRTSSLASHGHRVEARVDDFEPPPGTLDRNGLEVLGRDECLALVGTVGVGRIGLSMRALPASCR